MKRFKANMETLIMACGRHVICIDSVLDSYEEQEF